LSTRKYALAGVYLQNRSAFSRPQAQRVIDYGQQ